MALLDPLTSTLKALSPTQLRRLATARLSSLVLRELSRSRARVTALEKRYPTANTRELSQRLVDDKKGVAGVLGGVSGVFGMASVPADLLVMSYLQISLLVDVATVHKVNLKSARSRQELLDLFGHANGLGPIARAGPRVLGKVAGTLLEKGGLKTFGRALPLVAAPISAYLNNRHIQEVGEVAMRHYAGLDKAHRKAKRAASA